MKNGFKTLVAAIVILLMLPACFGSFRATRHLYRFNDTVSGNKFVKTLVFWVFVIIPVYALFSLGDAIIFNLVEFWSGTNPLSAHIIHHGNGHVIVESAGDIYEMNAIDKHTFHMRINGEYVGKGTISDDGQRLILQDNRTGRQVEQNVSELQATL